MVLGSGNGVLDSILGRALVRTSLRLTSHDPRFLRMTCDRTVAQRFIHRVECIEREGLDSNHVVRPPSGTNMDMFIKEGSGLDSI